MKKILIILFVLLTLFSQAQLTNVNDFKVANATTAFGRNIPIGTKVYNIATGDYWVATSGVVSTATLTTASASFTKLNSNATGTVTSVATGLGLSGGTITTTGTIALDTANASVLSRQRAANTYQVKGNYLTSEVDGSVTNEIQDLSGSGANLSGYTLSLTNDGTSVVLPNEKDPVLGVQNAVTHEPSGFEHPENVIVSYNSTNRTITLTGNTTAFWEGDTIAALTSGWTSSAHTATTGTWYLYYNGTSFVWSQDLWTFDMVQIAFVNYNVFAVRESHGLMQHQTHKELHETIGTYLTAGGDISDYNLNSTTAADRRPLVSSTSLMDEDNKSLEPALTTESYTRYYLSSTNTSNYAIASSDIVALSGNQPYYNQWTGSAWTQTLMSTGAYQAIWLVAIPVTADATSQTYRYLWVQGQSESTTLSTIQAQAPSSVSLGALSGLTPEAVFIGKIIIRYIGGNWQFISVEKLTGNKLSQTTLPAGNYLSIVNVNAPLSGNGTSTDPIALDTTSTKGVATQGDLATGLATKEPTLTKGNLTETVTGLEFNATQQVIGGAATLSLTTGYIIPTTTEQTNWGTAYTNRITSLTTTGSSGAATLSSNTLNIPNYTLSGLGGVPTSRTLTINGTAYDLSADRSWTVSAGSVAWGGITGTLSNQTDLNSALSGKQATLVSGTNIKTINGSSVLGSGDLVISGSMVYPGAGIPISTGTAWGTSITDNSANWNTAYSNRIATFTTTGSSGAATFSGNTLNIPNYTLSGLGGQPALNGTGFVKISGTTISYDNSTYLTAEVDGSTTNEIEVVDEVYTAANFNGATTQAVSQDDFYDFNHIGDTDDDGLANKVDLASAGFVKTAADGTLSVDGNTYLTTEVDGSITNEIQNLSYTASTRVLAIDGTGSTDATLPLFTSTDPGLVPLSGGGTTKFLRADGTWAAAGGGTGDVTKVGTPADNQVGIWTGNGTIEGDADLTFDGNILTTKVQKNIVQNGSKTANWTHDAASGDIGAYQVNLASSTISIHNLASGMQGTIFLNFVTTTPTTLTVNTFSDAGSTGLTEVVLGGNPTLALNKSTSVTYTCASDGTNTYVYLVYGQQP